MIPHNPEGYSYEFIDGCHGWRVLMLEEFDRPLPDDVQYYDDDDEEWQDFSHQGKKVAASVLTLRTQEEIPDWVPPAPPHFLNNPEGFDDDRLETRDGWRLATIGELPHGVPKPDDVQFWDDDAEEWKDCHQAGTPVRLFPDVTYRTKAPMPIYEAAIPEGGDLIDQLARLLGG